jgi:hypothetical protein
MKSTTEQKVTTGKLRELIDELWIAGDAAILSDYQNLSDLEVWRDYQWVAEIPATVWKIIRSRD